VQKISCIICESIDIQTLFASTDYISGSVHVICTCKTCDLAFVNPQPDKNELDKYYPTEYYGKEPFAYEKVDARTRFKFLKGLIVKRTGRMLDVGCGKGLLLKMVKDMGWEVIGTELSAHSANYGKVELGIDVRNQELGQLSFDNNSFDLVTLFHSLEHMLNPYATLSIINNIIKEDGLLLVSVPRFNCYYSKLFRANWFHLDAPRHLFHFSDKSLELLLNKAGFKVIRAVKYNLMYDSFGILQSLLNSFCYKYNLLNELNTKRLSMKDILYSNDIRLIFDAIVSMILQIILMGPLLLVTKILSLFNVGGTLTYIAHKCK